MWYSCRAPIGKTPTDTHKFLKQSEKHSKVSRSLIFKWHKRFADGRDSLADDEREGRPSFRESDAVKNEVWDVILMPPRLTFLINCFDNSTLFVKCSAVRICGTHLAHTRFIFKSFPKIWCAVVLEIPHLSADF
jgi:hypothetical protein